MEVNIVLEAIKFLILGMSTIFMFLMVIIFTFKFQENVIIKLLSHKKQKTFVNSSSAQQLSRQDNLALIATIAVSLQIPKK